MPPVGTSRRYLVHVETRYCKGCSICVHACPKLVLQLNGRQKAAVQNADACTGCLACEIYCPDFAIRVEEVPAHG